MKKGINKLFVISIIIVVILLIFFVVMIVKTINKNKLSDEEITTFNEKFLSYEGNLNGEQLKEFLDFLVSSNQNESENRQVNLECDTVKDTKGDTLILGEEGGKLVVLRNSDVIASNKSYKISFEYGSNKLINLVKVET